MQYENVIHILDELKKEAIEKNLPSLEDLKMQETPFKNAVQLQNEKREEMEKSFNHHEFLDQMIRFGQLLSERAPIKIQNEEWEDLKQKLLKMGNFIEILNEWKKNNPSRGNADDLVTYQEILEISDHQIEMIYQIGCDCIDEKLDEDALSVFVFLCTYAPNDARHWYILATLFMEKREFKKSIAYLEISRALRDDFLMVYPMLLHCYQSLNQDLKAQEVFNQMMSVIHAKPQIKNKDHWINECYKKLKKSA